MVWSFCKFFIFIFFSALLACSFDHPSSQFSEEELLNQLNHNWDKYDAHSSSNLDSALYYMQQVKVIAEGTGKEKWIAASYHSIADVKLKQGLLAESIHYYLKAIKYFKKLGDLPQLANAYVSVGVLYERQKDFEQAISYHLKAKDIFIYEGSSSDKTKVLRNLGIYYTETKNFKEAEQAFFQAEKIASSAKDFHRLSLIYNSLGVLNFRQEKYPMAQEFYRFAIQYADSIQNGEWQKSMGYHNLGEAYFFEGKDLEANEWLQKAIKAKEVLGDPILTQSSYNLLAQLRIKEKEYSEAVALLEGNLRIIDPASVDPSISESLALINHALLKMNEKAENSQLPFMNKMLGSYSKKLLAYNAKVSNLQEELETISQQQAVQAAVEQYAFNEQLEASEAVNEKMKYAFLIPFFFLIVAMVSAYKAVKKNMYYKKVYSNIEQVLNNSKALRHLK